MKLKIVWVGKTKEAAIQSLTEEYLKRLSRYVPAESQEFASEDVLFKTLGKAAAGRTKDAKDAFKEFSRMKIGDKDLRKQAKDRRKEL